MLDYLHFPLIGFSIIIGPLLLLGYLRSELFSQRTIASIASAALLIAAMTILQCWHGLAMLGVAEPLEQISYLMTLFCAPTLFVLFGRLVVLPDAPLDWRWALCGLPMLLPLLLPMQYAISLLLACGAGFAGWLSWVALTMRRERAQRGFELLFSAAVTLFAMLVLIIGILLPWLHPHYFYAIYSQCVGLAYALVVYALVAIPDFVTQLFELTRERYRTTALAGVDVIGRLTALDSLMSEEQVFRDDELSLASLGGQLDLTSHQLSELLNRHKGLSFSRYLRKHRTQAAAETLRREPDATILAIALECGYRSQSTFYAAFREEYGVSPGDYRRTPGTPN